MFLQTHMTYLDKEYFLKNVHAALCHTMNAYDDQECSSSPKKGLFYIMCL